jgi:hypothetical protein
MVRKRVPRRAWGWCRAILSFGNGVLVSRLRCSFADSSFVVQ